jgi:putative redox protein
MQSKVEWFGEHGLKCTNSNGQSLDLDWETGPSPMQVTLQMVGACSLVDVVIGLKERPFSKVWVELDSLREEQSPRVFTSIEMIYHVAGDIPQNLVERIVEKSHEKYCSVSNMINKSVNISWRVEIHD